MKNADDGTSANAPVKKPRYDRWIRFVSYVKRKVHERRAKKQKENPADKAAKLTAKATVWMAVFSFALTILVAIQFVILSRQLDVMRKDERAWISVRGDKDVTFDPATLHVPLAVINTGKSPAVDVHADLYVEVVPNGFMPHFESALIPHTQWSIGAMIPDVPLKVTAQRVRLIRDIRAEDYPVTPEEKTSLDQGKAWLAVHGIVHYKDVFNTPHWIRYCSWNFFKPGVEYSSRDCTDYNNVDRD